MWRPRIASEKCCVHRITNQSFCADSVHCSYVLDGTQLKWSTETRDLGVIIDSKLNFNKHVDVIVHKAHTCARLILRNFTSQNSTILTFVTYVRPILEYCTPAWSSLTINNINKIEAVQRRFTKRITGLSCINYFDRLHCLGLESLELRRLKYDLITCFTICHGDIDIEANSLFMFPCSSVTRGHKFKLFKQSARVNARKACFVNRVFSPWNDLPALVVESTSINSFKKRLETVNLQPYCKYIL